MATETLGAHLRNLLTPYKTLIELYKDGIIKEDFIKDFELNLKNLIKFSHTDKMENILWRKEGE